MSETTEDRINFDYDGGTLKFAGVVLVNLILQILTLGIFRFWARTRERRFLWSHVSLGDDRLEYTGRGLELFLGFIIAMIIMFPVIGVYQILLLAAGASIPGQVIVNLLYITVLMFLVHLAIYRARRYRLTRTLWRGIRGTLTGSPVRYGLAALAWLPAVMLSLGLAAPFMRIALLNREINNMHLGDRRFAFDGKARDLFAYWIVPWLTLLAVIAGYAWIMYLSFEVMNAAGIDPYDPESSQPNPETMDTERVNEAGIQMPAAFALLGIGGVLYMIAVAWYRVREFRYLAGRISFEGMSFSSEIGLGRVAWIYVSYLFTAAIAGLVIIVALTMLALVVNGVPLDPDMVGIGMGEILTELGEDARFFVTIGVMMTIAILLQTLSRVMVFHRLARAVVSSLALTGVQDFSQVTQALDASPRLGEGLADAFDLGDF
jgi:uncharacterized membrane protein YjgN (DUF898 family)